MNYYILDDNKEPVGPVGMSEYYEWQRQQPEESRTGIGLQLASTSRGGITVSTVYLGMDHRYDETRPVLWETMVFCDDHEDQRDQDCFRYCSHDEALEGHRSVCQDVLGEHGAV